MNLTGVIDVGYYTFSIFVMGFAIHPADFDSVSNFNLLQPSSKVSV